MNELKEFKDMLAEVMKLPVQERMQMVGDLAIILAEDEKNYLMFLMCSLDLYFSQAKDKELGLRLMDRLFAKLRENYLDANKEQEDGTS